MRACLHCDETAVAPLFMTEDLSLEKPFCCQGCMTVYQIIHMKGLESYYEIKSQSEIFKRRSPVELKANQFQFLDEADFKKEYSYLGLQNAPMMEFYLEGIHCLACLWLIEKIPEFTDGVQSTKLDLDRSVVTVVLKEDGKFSSVAREFNNLGYRPHPLRRNQSAADLKTKEERTALLRIGIAGAAAGNIMIYAVSLYGGATGQFAQIFNSLTVAFAIPVLSYSALPFYQNAWHALRNKTLSIDIPISFSLLMGAVMGIYNLLMGIADNYFDSLTTLVFLLLLSRYFLQKIQEKGLSASDLHFFYQSEIVLKCSDLNQFEFKEVHPRFLQKEDILKIRPGDFFPADGVILKGKSSINNGLLTGESYPVNVAVGDEVFSGTQNLEQELIIKVLEVQETSRLGKLLKEVETGWAHRSRIVNITSSVSKYFTLVVLLLSVLLFAKLFLTHDFKHALEGAITLLIVTCPCALALAVPLTFTKALSQAARQGIVIKSDEVIEKLAQIRNVFIDKTGTITHGKLKVSSFEVKRNSFIDLKDIIHYLESGSRHPVGVALLASIQSEVISNLEVQDRKEIPGRGVEGFIGNNFYEINKLGIFENLFLIATFKVLDTVRSDSEVVLTNLKKLGLDVKILSGDKKEVVQKIAQEVGITESNALFDLSPEQKSALIKNTEHSMMIGDGANDAVALGSASVGVAVMGAMDISLRAADVYLTYPGITPIEKIIILSRETMKVIHRNLILSLLYNSLSVAAAFAGIINPLIAAIIMPVSSLTILFSTIWGTKELRNLWKS